MVVRKDYSVLYFSDAIFLSHQFLIIVFRKYRSSCSKIGDGLRCYGLAAPKSVAGEPRMGLNMNSPKCKLGVRDEHR